MLFYAALFLKTFSTITASALIIAREPHSTRFIDSPHPVGADIIRRRSLHIKNTEAIARLGAFVLLFAKEQVIE